MTTILEIWNERRKPFLCRCSMIDEAQDYLLVLALEPSGLFRVRYKLKGYECIEAKLIQGSLIATYIPTSTHTLFRIWPFNPVVKQELLEALKAPQR